MRLAASAVCLERATARASVGFPLSLSIAFAVAAETGHVQRTAGRSRAAFLSDRFGEAASRRSGHLDRQVWAEHADLALRDPMMRTHGPLGALGRRRSAAMVLAAGVRH